MSTVILVLSVIGAGVLCAAGYTLLTEQLASWKGISFSRCIELCSQQRRRCFRMGIVTSVFSGPSSSVVLTLSVVDSTRVHVRHIPWMFLGINLGSVFWAWIFALACCIPGLTGWALPLLALTLLFSFSSRPGPAHLGDLLKGAALLLLGIGLLNESLPEGSFLGFLPEGIPVYLLGFLLGAAITMGIRSLPSALVLAMALSCRGELSYPLGASIILGGMIGLSGIGCLASAGLGRYAKRSALFYLMMNIILSVWALLFMDSALWGFPSDPVVTPLILAGFYTLLQVIHPVVMSVLGGPVMRLAEFVLGRAAKEDETGGAVLDLISYSMPDSLESNMMIIQAGLARMASWAHEMLMIVMNASQGEDPDERSREILERYGRLIIVMDQEMTRAVTRQVQQQCSQLQAELIHHQQRVAHELKEIGAACRKSMKVLDGKHQFHGEGRDELFIYISQILDFLAYVEDYLGQQIQKTDVALAQEMEDAIDEMRDHLTLQAGTIIETCKGARVQEELAFIDLVRYLEHVGDSCLSIAETIPEIRRRFASKPPRPF